MDSDISDPPQVAVCVQSRPTVVGMSYGANSMCAGKPWPWRIATLSSRHGTFEVAGWPRISNLSLQRLQKMPARSQSLRPHDKPFVNFGQKIAGSSLGAVELFNSLTLFVTNVHSKILVKIGIRKLAKKPRSEGPR